MKILFLILFVSTAFNVNAQQTNTPTIDPPYKRFPTLPPLQILLSDSTTKYTKENLPQNKPLLLMLFSPDCDHCQHEATELVANKNELKNIQVVMVSTSPVYRINQFIQDYKLSEIPNLVIGKDLYYLLLPFYDVKNFPVLALYNGKGQLIEVIEGSLPVSKVLQKFKEKH